MSRAACALRDKEYGSRAPVPGDERGATAGNRIAPVRVRFDREGKVTDVNVEASSGDIGEPGAPR